LTAENASLSYQLTAEGASLSYQLCSSFFKTAGTEQQWLLFSRDVIAVIGTLTTGILGATHASPAATAWVGIGSGAALSGISIYARNFLFSEDNVQAVQDLTLKAMAAQTAATLKLAKEKGNDYSFFDSVRDIMNIQAVCEVQNILSLVRNSIRQASLETTRSSGNQITTDVASPASTTIVLPPAVPGPVESQHRASLEELYPQFLSLSFNQLQVMIKNLPSPNASTNPLVAVYPQWQTNANQARKVLRAWPQFDDTIVDQWVSAFVAAKKSPK
jgi:hypothetical protein